MSMVPTSSTSGCGRFLRPIILGITLVYNTIPSSKMFELGAEDEAEEWSILFCSVVYNIHITAEVRNKEYLVLH